MTVRDLRRLGERTLSEAGSLEASVDARYLLEDVLACSYTELLMRLEEEISEDVADRYLALIARRSERIPLQHLLGKASFMGLTFLATPDVLIPRADTEVLVETVLPFCKGKEVLDVCTGSGCIAISLAVLGGCSRVVASDLLEEALVVARENAKRLCAEVSFMQSDLFAEMSGRYDVIVSNPPYIRTEEIASLAPEVRDHDPHLALDGGEDGLSIYRRLIGEAPKYLKNHGLIALEIGADQAFDVQNLMAEAGFIKIHVKKDLAGLDRVVMGYYEYV